MKNLTQLTRLYFAALAGAVLMTPSAIAQTSTEDMAAAANHFLASLSAEQKEKATFEWNDEERFDWHFIPKERLGLPLKEMADEQRELAHALLASALSQRGYIKAVTIMSLEKVLWALENQAPHRDPANYYFSIFGTPAPEGTWGWRVEGHHLSLNFTIVKGRFLSTTPSFMGANPARVPSGPRAGLRVLAVEEDLGRELVKSFTPEQRKIAILDVAVPRDIITGADRQARKLEPMGLSTDRMNEEQVEMLRDLLHEYVFRIHGRFAEPEWDRIMKNPELHFAWAGGLEPGQGHYYRIQGAGFLVEYDNTQNDANHVHAVWRNLDNDFGLDYLREHYENEPH